jgi:hypothetical protein
VRSNRLLLVLPQSPVALPSYRHAPPHHLTSTPAMDHDLRRLSAHVLP